ncbi:hypothetical protein C1N91_13980 [Curtobacterium sp. SGAir0471]|nr:hypothetical protein C1N91_13980 [Curtobacterium sp. SGAir0471]
MATATTRALVAALRHSTRQPPVAPGRTIATTPTTTASVLATPTGFHTTDTTASRTATSAAAPTRCTEPPEAHEPVRSAPPSTENDGPAGATTTGATGSCRAGSTRVAPPHA